MKKIKYFIPSFILMIIIFMFSQQTGNESSGLSSQIVLWIQTYLHIPITELIVRKAAHMSEYAVLTLTFIYEFHQLFIGGRAGQFTDVLIDTCGALITIVIYYFYNYWKRKNSSLK